MKKSYIVIILLLSAIGLFGQRYSQIAYIPNGVMDRYIKAFDANQDGYIDLIFTGKRLWPGDSVWVVFYSYRPYNRYFLADYLRGFRYFWDIGFIDNDSLPDATMSNRDLYVYESPAPDSYPKSVVWQQRPNPPAVYWTGYITDLDRDGKKEIATRSESTRIFECVGDNQYTLVWGYYGGGTGAMDWADFDQDGKTEFVIANNGRPSVIVFECTGNDSYQLVFQDTLPHFNHRDVIAIKDMDNDGLSEFLIGADEGYPLKGYFWLYEAVGDNNYDIIFHDSLTGLPFQNYWAMSYSGDIDSDGKEELIWAVKNNWMIYKATGNNTFERVFMAYPHPNGNRMDGTCMYVCDINGNGYPEIIESREDYAINFIQETVIWEIKGVSLHRPNGGEILQPDSQFPICWEKFTPPGTDSFSLFVCFDNGRNFRTIATGIPANDTLYLWNVPDSLSDSCKIMIWAYGPPNPVTGKIPAAWDFSDTVFSIRQTRIKEDTRYRIQEAGLKILQNPARKEIRLQLTDGGQKELKIYDVTGKLVIDLNFRPSEDGRYRTIVLNPGVYFVRVGDEKKIITKKVVVIE